MYDEGKKKKNKEEQKTRIIIVATKRIDRFLERESKSPVEWNHYPRRVNTKPPKNNKHNKQLDLWGGGGSSKAAAHKNVGSGPVSVGSKIKSLFSGSVGKKQQHVTSDGERGEIIKNQKKDNEDKKTERGSSFSFFINYIFSQYRARVGKKGINDFLCTMTPFDKRLRSLNRLVKKRDRGEEVFNRGTDTWQNKSDQARWWIWGTGG